MTLTITIAMDNAAFEDLDGELSSILGFVAQEVQPQAGWSHNLRDSNGNTVGRAVVTE